MNGIAVGTSAAPRRGIAFTVLGGLLLTMNDAVLKWLTGDYPVGQIMVRRELFVFLPIALFAWGATVGGGARRRPGSPN